MVAEQTNQEKEPTTPTQNRQLYNLLNTPSFVHSALATPKSTKHIERALREVGPAVEAPVVRVPTPPNDSPEIRPLSDLLPRIQSQELPLPLYKVNLWRDGKKVPLTESELENWNQFLDEMPPVPVFEVARRRNREKTSQSKQKTVKSNKNQKPSKRKTRREKTTSEEVSWCEQESDIEMEITKVKRQSSEKAEESATCSDSSSYPEARRTIKMETRSHAKPDLVMLRRPIIEDDESIEDDLDFPTNSHSPSGLPTALTESPSGLPTCLAATSSGLQTALAATSSGLPTALTVSPSGLPTCLAATSSGLPSALTATSSGFPTALTVSSSGLPSALTATSSGFPTALTCLRQASQLLSQ
ncbi:hypothetical protein BLNAU_13644 [Blattamonas nauphoetae]|uniref:Uncharacterized protein n=2 Tax=Blattamonas nauphoetae TaxID=2049346 RepID=A0ABQ9XG90_9EUKA|nr:hypothetical protein BLNAU_13644 [Blattamonas nauphoetae]